MSSQYLHTASANHIGSTHGDRLSRYPTPANHHSDTPPAKSQHTEARRQTASKVTSEI